MEGFDFRILIAILLVVSFLVAKKAGVGKKMGCVGYGYISLVVFLVGLFAVMITYFLTSSVINGVQTYTDGEKYMATIVSYSSYEKTDDDGDRVTMYTPTYEIKISEEEVYRVEDNISSGGNPPIVGEIVELYYDKTTGKMLQFSAGMIIMGIGMFIMWFVLAFAFVGILLYLFNYEMSKYFKILQKVGMGFFVPLVMIAFEALLIYALFYGNEVPKWVSALLIFFIVMLGLGIWGYLKMIFSKGMPKWKRTSDTSWSADWDEEDDEYEEDNDDMYNEKIIEEGTNKQMIPLDKDLLNGKNEKE